MGLLFRYVPVFVSLQSLMIIYQLSICGWFSKLFKGSLYIVIFCSIVVAWQLSLHCYTFAAKRVNDYSRGLW